MAGSSAANEAGNGATPTAHQAAQTQPAASQADFDDFGLPIKKYIPPIEENTEDDGTPVPVETVETPKQDDEQAAPGAEKNEIKHTEQQPSESTTTETTKPPVQLNSDSDSDDADFKDAQSEIQSGSGTASPKKGGKPKKSHLEVSNDDKNDSGTATPTPATASGVSTPIPAPGATTPKPADVSKQLCAEPADSVSTPTGEKTNGTSQDVSADAPKSSTDQPRPSQDLSAADSAAHPKVAHSRNTSTVSNGVGVSEFSHQQLSLQPEAQVEHEDEGWQEMPAFARYDMYNDDDKLVAREMKEDEMDTYGYADLGGAGKGYTRVLMDEDAESATSMDENTQYLFKDVNTTSMNDDDARDAVSQMQATKDLLTEGQRIAYVGLVRLEIATITKEGEGVEAPKKVKKLVNTSAENTMMWGQKMMMRVYAHMDISEAEQVMIEQLADHGVQPADLTPVLLTNARVQNPMAEKKEKRSSATPSPNPEDELPAEMPPPYESVENQEAPEVKMPSELPDSAKIDIDLRWTVLCDLFLVLIADSIYDARSRILLERVAKTLDISWLEICRFEKRVTDALEMQQAAEKEDWNEDEHMEARRKEALKRRYVMMGLATVGGGLVIGLSAGLLAPVIGAGLAAGFTTIGVGGTSSFLAGAGGAAIITSSAAASGSLIGGRAANRRTGPVRTFEYRPLHNNKRVNLVVTVSGWLTGKMDDVRLPFSTVDPIMGDIYSVLWEPEMLRSTGDTMNILATEALTQGLQQVLGQTVLISLMAALQLPLVLTKLSYLIDNPWAVSLDRATSAGLILADSLLERSLGTRPITLVGYSLGSRVIFSCLQELAKKGAYGLVQNVYLFGSPMVVKKEEYIRARTVVSGRFLNGYNRNDWILGYLFRLTNGGIRSVAGLAPIEGCPWVENMDVTEFVKGHMAYRTAMPKLLMECGWNVTSEEFSEIEDPDPENHGERQRELINEIEEARKELEKEGKASKGGKFSIFGRKKKMERQEWEVYEESAGSKGANGEKNSNHGVLFDIDAIRAELAREAQQHNEDPDLLQIKEIKSTLPPMKLDIPPTSVSSKSSPVSQMNRDSLRETQSAEALPIRTDRNKSRSPSRLASGVIAGAAAGGIAGSAYHFTPDYREDEMQMAFDTSFDDSAPTRTDADYESERPGLKTANTLPDMAIADPWADPDDEDFGKEQEISMTFA